MKKRIELESARGILPALALIAAASAGVSHAAPQGAGHCLVFDGVDDFVGVPRTTSLEPDQLTVELWARLDGPQDWNTRLLRKGLDDAYFLGCDVDFDRRMQFMVTRGDSIRVQARDTHVHDPYIGSWHHFIGVYALDHMEFLVDGVQVSSVAHALGALTHQPLTDLCIGAGLPIDLQNEYFAGRIDEVRIWSYPRSTAEIQASWNTSVPDAEPGLVASWHFDESSGQVASDSSTSGNHGQLGWTDSPEASDPTWMISDVPLDQGPCSTERYCASRPNSTGVGAVIDIVGSLSISANDTHLLASHCPPAQHGIFFYGGTRVQYPFGDGYLCVSPLAPGLVRIAGVQLIDASGAVDLALDFAHLPAAGEIVGGSSWNFQFWYRDPLADGSGFNLTDAMGATFCP